MPPEISIVTPTYNMLPYLKRCLTSVKDQNVCCEHIVVDGNSSDGTKDWLRTTAGIQWVSEKDNGMYDALNKGLQMAQGNIIGHLNADEQYLPGTLETVVRFFEQHPYVDYITGDYLLVDPKGELIAYRKAFKPYWPLFFSNYLYTYTCTLFYRKRVVQSLCYDDRLRSIADADFLLRVQRQGFKGAHLKRFMATFTYSGDNLSLSDFSLTERAKYEKERLPRWFRPSRFFLRSAFFAARVFYGTLQHRGAIEYEIYASDSGESKRKVFRSEKPTWQITT